MLKKAQFDFENIGSLLSFLMWFYSILNKNKTIIQLNIEKEFSCVVA